MVPGKTRPTPNLGCLSWRSLTVPRWGLGGLHTCICTLGLRLQADCWEPGGEGFWNGVREFL